MPLSAGTHLGAYEILSALGAGGMGEVYRATDTKLKRQVAVKILPPALAADPDRLARFQREAEVLAALNHPHIAAIYGLEDADGVKALVMELVDGDDLSQRIASGPIPLDEVLPIARQIAEALEAAHEQGIIHRDLKPANIKVRPDGAVKVLDFGLAKLTEPEAAGPAGRGDLSQSPTLTGPALMTGMGVILGTAAYMSPEQAKGFPADQRSDIFSFGVVLFEMLTGRQPFHGETAPEILASVLIREADLNTLPPNVNPRLVDLLKRCLQKNPKQRWQHIGDMRAELETIAADPHGASAAAYARAAPGPWPLRVLSIVAAALVSGALAAAVAWTLKPERAAVVARFAVLLAEGQAFTNTGRQVVAISPDGTKIVYVANQRLFLRAIRDAEARPLQGSDATGSVLHPVFSPDGASIAYWAAGDQTIKRISVVGGAPVTITPSTPPYGMTWSGDHILLGRGAAGIARVPATGGALETIVKVDATETAHGPQLLPGGDAVLFTLAKALDTDRWDKANVVVQSLKTGERTTVVEGGSDGRYLPTGHLVYALGGILFAAPLDVRHPAPVRGATPIVEGVRRAGRTGAALTGTAQFSVSETGSLVYLEGPASLGQLDIALIDLKGGAQTLRLPPGDYQAPRLSPDGRQVAVATDDGKEAIVWVYDLAGTSSMRKLTIGGRNLSPIWSADGQRVLFQSDRDGDVGVFWQRADGTGNAERLTKADTDTAHVPESVSPDGKYLLFGRREKGYTLQMYAFADRKTTPFNAIASGAPTCATFSPDGRWVAYTTARGFASTVYVQSFPATGNPYEIGLGSHPMWSRDGKQLFFVQRQGQFMSVSISSQPTFAFGNPASITRSPLDQGPGTQRPYDITPDGKFVGVVTAGATETDVAVTSRIEVVLNWFEELKARVPTK